ncbi:hypothetical protein ACHHYP_16079 [Achlya hypogyna]|uniref:Uncharacterized protein n=1 Tax=Achlya hypogyna TaxID=1202772 RepID=A0A1V9Y9J8_ACHHY|nr:hypothetical protein ACHHYP_16079 [Achlya hypogyna]
MHPHYAHFAFDVFMKTPSCDFKGCQRPVDASTGTKHTCAVHKYRRHCAIPLCTNQVYARKLCARHGGKRTCKVDQCCAATTGRGGYCAAHNAKFARDATPPLPQSSPDDVATVEVDEDLWSPLAFQDSTRGDPLLVEISPDVLSLILDLDETR